MDAIECQQKIQVIQLLELDLFEQQAIWEIWRVDIPGAAAHLVFADIARCAQANFYWSSDLICASKAPLAMHTTASNFLKRFH